MTLILSGFFDFQRSFVTFILSGLSFCHFIAKTLLHCLHVENNLPLKLGGDQNSDSGFDSSHFLHVFIL